MYALSNEAYVRHSVQGAVFLAPRHKGIFNVISIYKKEINFFGGVSALK